jgi:hypothetical protein
MPYWDWARREAPPFPTAALNSTVFAKNKDFYRNKSFQGPRVIDDSEVTVRRDYNPLFTFPFPAGTINDIKEVRAFHEHLNSGTLIPRHRSTSRAEEKNPFFVNTNQRNAILSWTQQAHH